jgi:very-short-patch-repair endonuclease
MSCRAKHFGGQWGSSNMPMELIDYIKYCLGYIKLSRQKALSSQEKQSLSIPKEYFSLMGLLNGDLDGNVSEELTLPVFYTLDPKDIPAEKADQYAREKAIASKVEDLYNIQKNDEFTKQIVLSFGYFEIELPVEAVDDDEDKGPADETSSEPNISSEPVRANTTDDMSEPKTANTKKQRFPLFSLLVRIEKRFVGGVGRYSFAAIDPEVQVNIGSLETVLGTDLYFQVVREIAEYERNQKLSMPFASTGVFDTIWQHIKAQLRLGAALFNEQSFSLEDMHLALTSRSNYFLAEDLQRLVQVNAQELDGCSLVSWTSNDQLSETDSTPEERNLYFPFKYDKYQLNTLSVLSNRAAIIQGPPGTGKSETIANILCHLAASGKKVLFVSQKAQALKVVKDRLRGLGVKYLFGYIPNPSSLQLGEQDEEDGIAPQLTGLKAHIETIGQSTAARGPHDQRGQQDHKTLEQTVAEIEGSRDALNELLRNERRLWQLDQEEDRLLKFELSVDNWSAFKTRLDAGSWEEIKSLKERIRRSKADLQGFERTAKAFPYNFDIECINWSLQDLNCLVKEIHTDISERWYDGSIGMVRRTHHSVHKLRCWKTRSKLPREIRDHIDWILTQDLSRNKTAHEIESLRLFTCFHHTRVTLNRLQESYATALSDAGLSEEACERLDNLVRDHKCGFEEVKHQILRLHQIKTDRNGLDFARSPNRLKSDMNRLTLTRSQTIARYIQNLINQRLKIMWQKGPAVRGLVEILAKAFGKSKKAYKTFDRIRQTPDNFLTIQELVPIWMMELDDASRIIPLKKNLFDYVILDEASQCNIAYTLPVMFRAQRAVFVGDSEQMKDGTTMFRANRSFDELAHKYSIPEELQIKGTGTSVQSVLDIATLRGFLSIPLRYHYRSPAELIGFSNEYFYKPKGKKLIPLNNNYLTYKETGRVMIVHQVTPNGAQEISDHTNYAEAEAILTIFRSLREDPRYAKKSVGILSFFNAQASLIRRIFEQSGLDEGKDNYKVSIIEGIQGDEKDIILYSFVARSPEDRKRYQPLTGEGGDIRGDINKGRVNVAFSRAKLQTHCFLSLPISQVPEKIWIKKYLQYVEEKGSLTHHANGLCPFDSYFEEEFYGLAKATLGADVRVQNQVKSCGFKIDFVFSNTTTGNQLAVECDGPTHFKDEIDEAYGIHVEDDEERQRVLEAAGWEFYRVKYSDWIKSDGQKERVIQELGRMLGTS